MENKEKFVKWIKKSSRRLPRNTAGLFGGWAAADVFYKIARDTTHLPSTPLVFIGEVGAAVIGWYVGFALFDEAAKRLKRN